MQKNTELSEMSVIWKDETDSTNMDALRGKSAYPDKTVWAAGFQSAGRGQRGNKWTSTRSQNLTFSILLKPFNILATSQFLISQTASVAMVDYLTSRGIKALIKWPNDIYVSDRKICGILIEHFITGDKVSSSIVGIGLNVCQTDFPDDLPNPVSMIQCNSSVSSFNLKEELSSYLSIFSSIYDSLDKESDRRDLDIRYQELMYRRGEWHHFNELSSDGCCVENTINGCIEGVDKETSRLILKKEDGTIKLYAFKEIAYII